MSGSNVNAVAKIPAITVTVGTVLALAVIATIVLYIYMPATYQGALVFAAAACAAAGQLAVALYTLRLLRATIQTQIDGSQAANNQTEALHKQTNDLRTVIEGLDARAVQQIQILSTHAQALVLRSEALANRAKIEAIYRYAERWTSPELTSDRNHAREAADLRANPEKFREMIENSPEKRRSVGNILNFLEQLSLSVAEGHCDAEVAKRLFSGVVVNLWYATESWVKETRNMRGRPRLWAGG